MSRDRVAIGLGSNLGDRLGHLRYGVGRLRGWLDSVRCSSVYETRPYGVSIDQPPFLNACCTAVARGAPRTILDRLLAIERSRGRQRTRGDRGAPRVLDLDLLLYGDRVVEERTLRLPHPRLAERAFVLLPLAEIAPDWVHPTLGTSVAALARRIGEQGATRRPKLSLTSGRIRGADR